VQAWASALERALPLRLLMEQTRWSNHCRRRRRDCRNTTSCHKNCPTSWHTSRHNNDENANARNGEFGRNTNHMMSSDSMLGLARSTSAQAHSNLAWVDNKRPPFRSSRAAKRDYAWWSPQK
jgi:hypothetical protein